MPLGKFLICSAQHTIEESKEQEESETQSPRQVLDERNLDGKQRRCDEHHHRDRESVGIRSDSSYEP